MSRSGPVQGKRRSRAVLPPLLGVILLFGGPAQASDQETRVSAEALLPNMAVLSIDGKRRTLRAGERSPEGVELVAADSDSATIRMNGAQHTLKLGSHISGSFSGPPPGEVHRVLPTRNGMYLTDGAINGFSLPMLVDTGATLVAFNRATAERLGIPYRLEGQPTRIDTASGNAPGFLVTLASVRVGRITERDVDAIVVDGDAPTTVLLGNSFLNRMQLSREGAILELRTGPAPP